MSEPRDRSLHVLIACVVLLCFALIKVSTVFAARMGLLSEVAVLESSEATFMLVTGMAELITVVLIINFFSNRRASQVIALIGAAFLLYRFAVNPTYCVCMGALPYVLPWLRTHEQMLLLTTSSWFFLSGLWGWALEANLTAKIPYERSP